jgi:hypothetical protein
MFSRGHEGFPVFILINGHRQLSIKVCDISGLSGRLCDKMFCQRPNEYG